ncbi:MAG: hypothetical protein JWN17_2418 [Frankiales bacterium]|nr:hypothetical protein [Frankiales bacterium]
MPPLHQEPRVPVTSRLARPAVVGTALLLLCTGLPLALAGQGTGAAAAPGVRPPAVPESGLRYVLGGEAGRQTLDTTKDPLIQHDTATEPSLAVDPADPDHVVIGYQEGRDDAGGDITNGFSTSFDGGKTWKVGVVPGLTSFDPVSPTSPYTRGSDAVVAFGPVDPRTHKSVVYFSSLVFDPTGLNTRSAIVDSTSHDGGLTWDLPTVVQDDDGGGLNDKNWLVVDTSSAPGHHLGRVYVVWDRVAGVIAKYSDDQGKTWVGPPSPAYLPNVYAAQGIGAIPLVLPSGALAVTFLADVAPVPVRLNPGDELAEAAQGVSRVVTAVAPLAGQTPSGLPLVFTPPTSVTAFGGAAVRHQRAGGLVSADVDPRTGRVFVTVEDASGRPDGNNDVVLLSSDDVEAAQPTWTRTRVNGGPTGDQVDHYDPAVAVGKGTVRVMWRQRQETASADVTTYATRVSTWVAQSVDGGKSFAPALRVDRDVNDVRFAAFSRGGAFQGDYDQIATATDGRSYVVHAEAVPQSAAEVPPAVPSATTVHHQRMWVTSVRGR